MQRLRGDDRRPRGASSRPALPALPGAPRPGNPDGATAASAQLRRSVPAAAPVARRLRISSACGATMAPRMKLVIQIPCLDEEATLPRVLGELPRAVDGFHVVEWLIVDDGSSDRTVEVARAHGVDHVVRLTNNKGLAAAFQAGIDAALKLGADVIVNTDADHQYRSADIPKLVAPILAGRADMVVGDRQVKDVRPLLGLEEAASAPGKLGRAARLGHPGPGHDLRLSRLQPGGRTAAPGRLQLHLHAREPDPGRQDAGRGRARRDCDAIRRPGVPPGRLDAGLRAPQRARDLPCLRPIRAAARVHHRRLRIRGRRADRLHPVHARLDRERRSEWPRPVADPGRGAGADRRADVRARRRGRRDRRAAGDRAADLRAGQAPGASGRNRALSLRARGRA